MSYQNEHLTRQLDLVPMEILGTPITIIGAGAIGSWTTLALAKMGFEKLEVWDFDQIDTVNLNSQFFPHRSVGRFKVDVLSELVTSFTGTEIKTNKMRYEYGVFPGIVISAVDSMAVRQLIWESHKDKAPRTKAIIDPRMGAETALLYVMDPMVGVDQQTYQSTLYNDSQAVQERCTAKATIYTANLLSGLVCKAVVDVLTRKDYLRSASWNIRENAFEGAKRRVAV